MEQIEITIDMETKSKTKKVMSKLKLRSMLKSMAKEGLIDAYEVVHWSYDNGCGYGDTVISSTEEVRDE